MDDDSGFYHLCDLLGEMQNELALRKWTEASLERIERASRLRRDLWDAIAAYRDHYSPATKVTP